MQAAPTDGTCSMSSCTLLSSWTGMNLHFYIIFIKYGMFLTKETNMSSFLK